jgi:hypothetical protein
MPDIPHKAGIKSSSPDDVQREVSRPEMARAATAPGKAHRAAPVRRHQTGPFGAVWITRATGGIPRERIRRYHRAQPDR